MNLRSNELNELNELLAKEKTKVPDFRKDISATGANYVWWQKNIKKINPNVSDRVKELLKI